MKTTAITTLLPAASAVGQPGIVADYTNQLRGGGGQSAPVHGPRVCARSA